MRLLLGPPYSPFDLAVIVIVSFRLVISLASAAFVLHFHIRSSSPSPSPQSLSLRRRLRLLLHLNSLWPVRLLLVLFAALLSVSELLRLIPQQFPLLCKIYALSSQSFLEPAFFATLIFLLRASTDPKNHSSFSFAAAFTFAIFTALPLVALHVLYLTVIPWAFPNYYFFLDYNQPSSVSERCTHPLVGTVLLASFCVIYVPLFVSACWEAVIVVINKKLRIRLYVLTMAVVAALSMQVSAIAMSSLWPPSRVESEWFDLAAFVAVLVGVGVGEGILVVKPVLDALDVVEPEQGMNNWHGDLDVELCGWKEEG